MVDSKDVKEICYYGKIVDYIYEEDDQISDYLINYYRDYVIKNICDTNLKNIITQLDLVLYQYINDIKFNTYVKDYLKDSLDTILCLDQTLIQLYDGFNKNKLKKVTNTKWL